VTGARSPCNPLDVIVVRAWFLDRGAPGLTGMEEEMEELYTEG
jgi:hypothetical protein